MESAILQPEQRLWRIIISCAVWEPGIHGPLLLSLSFRERRWRLLPDLGTVLRWDENVVMNENGSPWSLTKGMNISFSVSAANGRLEDNVQKLFRFTLPGSTNVGN